MHIHLRIGPLDAHVHLYVRTCTRVYLHIRVCPSTHIRSYVCVDLHTLYVDVYGCVRMCVYVCAYACAYTHAGRCVYGSMHVRARISVHPHLCVYITRIHTCASVGVDTSAFLWTDVGTDPDVSARMSVCIRACAYPCTSVYPCLCLRIYTRASTHGRDA